MFALAAVAVANLVLAEAGLGVSPYNDLLALVAFAVERALFGSLFWALGRWRRPAFHIHRSE